MRAGIPNARARARTVTLYIDTARFMQALGIPSKNEVHVLLVDRQGGILWRTTGSFHEAKGAELAQVIASHLQAGRAELRRNQRAVVDDRRPASRLDAPHRLIRILPAHLLIRYGNHVIAGRLVIWA
jgi:hypothetical protein